MSLPTDPSTAPIQASRRSLKSWILGTRTNTCPRCGSSKVRPSQKAGARGGLVVFRCRNCKHHFKAVSTKSGLWARASVAVFLALTTAVAASFFLTATPHGTEAANPSVQADPEMARVSIQAKRGDPDSEYYLGWVSWQRAEYSQALPWLTKAAEHGHGEAAYLLAMANLKGRGTIQNFRTAEDHFKQAAEGGHLESQYQLGLMLRDGLAHLPDKENAYVWLNVAAARGHEDALLYRDKLSAAMTTEEIVRAQEVSARMHSRLVPQATAAMGPRAP